MVASFYPLAYVAERVGGNRVEVANLTPVGVEPHDLELTPDQVDAIEDADLVLLLGQGFQAASEEVARRRRDPTISVLDELRLDAGAAEEVDPHVWLDPVLLSEVVGRVQSVLDSVDPKGARDRRANSDDLRGELEALHGRFVEGLANCERRDVVTTHAAFSYLTSRYGLEQRPITGLSPESEPEPGRLAELADLIRREGLTTVFYEELVPRDLADTLAREAGVEVAVLSPLEGLSAEEVRGGDDYFTVMDRNLAALRRALNCA